MPDSPPDFSYPPAQNTRAPQSSEVIPIIATKREQELITPPGRLPRFCDHYDILQPAGIPLTLGQTVKIYTLHTGSSEILVIHV